MADNIAAGSSLSCWSTACGKSKRSIMLNKSCCALEVAKMSAQDFTRHPIEKKNQESQNIKLQDGERVCVCAYITNNRSIGLYFPLVTIATKLTK